MTQVGDTQTLRRYNAKINIQHVCAVFVPTPAPSSLPTPSPPSLTDTRTLQHRHTRLTLFAFAYTQRRIKVLNCYHMVAIARAPNRSKTRSAAEKWGAGVEGGARSERGLRSHLYIRSMSISGSSWNSLIFTVSDKMLLRFLRRSSTLKTQERN